MPSLPKSAVMPDKQALYANQIDALQVSSFTKSRQCPTPDNLVTDMPHNLWELALLSGCTERDNSTGAGKVSALAGGVDQLFNKACNLVLLVNQARCG